MYLWIWKFNLFKNLKIQISMLHLVYLFIRQSISYSILPVYQSDINHFLGIKFLVLKNLISAKYEDE